MKYLLNNAATPQGGVAAHQGRTGVESNNKSTSWGQFFIYAVFGIATGVAAYQVLSSKSTNKKRYKERTVVDVDFEKEADVPELEVPETEMEIDVVATPSADAEVGNEISVEDRIRQLRADGKTYPAIAHELHVSIRFISRVLKSKE